MNKDSLVEGLRAIEHQITTILDRLNTTRDRMVQLVEDELHDRQAIKGLANTFHEDLIMLRELYQQVIYRVELLANSKSGNQ